MTRIKFTSKFKTKVVLEALKERETIQDLAQKFKKRIKSLAEFKVITK